MSVSDLLLIVGVIAVAVFGFLNGWVFRRSLMARTESKRSQPGTAERDVSADLIVTDVEPGIETYHEEAVAAFAEFEDEPGAETDTILSKFEPEHAVRFGTADDERHAYRELQAELAASRIELAELKERLGRLDDLEARVRSRDAWLTDLQSRQRADLHKKDVEISQCEARINDLVAAVAELRGMEQVIAEMDSLKRRLDDAESQQATRMLESERVVQSRTTELERLRGELAVNTPPASVRVRPGTALHGTGPSPQEGTTPRFRGVVLHPSGMLGTRLRQHADPV